MPLSIFVTATLCDLSAQVTGYDLFGITGFYNIVAGLMIGFVALLVVSVELLTAPTGAACRELVGTVCAAMMTMIGVFALVWSVRLDGPRAGNGWLLTAEVAAIAVGILAAWFGHGVVIGRHRREPVQVWLPACAAHRR